MDTGIQLSTNFLKEPSPSLRSLFILHSTRSLWLQKELLVFQVLSPYVSTQRTNFTLKPSTLEELILSQPSPATWTWCCILVGIVLSVLRPSLFILRKQQQNREVIETKFCVVIVFYLIRFDLNLIKIIVTAKKVSHHILIHWRRREEPDASDPSVRV